ncbi:MAG: LLM class flavin-dependent oxidoreductase [Acidobacteriota bacterium]
MHTWSLPADDTTTLNVRPTRPVPLFVASNRPEGAREVGRQALSLLTLLSASAESLAVLESRLREHRRGLEEGGHAPDSAEVAVALFAHVAESAEQARAVARPSFVKFADAHGVPDGASDYDTMEERGTALLGDPDRAIETLHELAALGVDEAILWMSFGGLPVDELARSFACLEQRVRPALAIG